MMPVLAANIQWQRPHFNLQVGLQCPVGVTVLFGVSGSGKTSVLRCLAGLEQGASATITFAGQVWQSAHQFMPTHHRRVGYVFQEPSLLPHLSVQGNLQYAFKRAKAGALSESDWLGVLELLGIEGLLERYPEQLSGGEAQRVAIARALLSQPQVLLMDEPLAALDNQRKHEVLPYLERLCQRMALPIVYVTHSLDEVTRLAQQLVVLANGQVVAAGPVQTTLAQLPVALALGREACVVLEGHVASRDASWYLMTVALAGNISVCLSEPVIFLGQPAVGALVRLRVNANDVSLTLSPPQGTSILNVLQGCITALVNDESPAHCLVNIALAPSVQVLARITAKSAAQLALVPGLSIYVQIKAVALA